MMFATGPVESTTATIIYCSAESDTTGSMWGRAAGSSRWVVRNLTPEELDWQKTLKAIEARREFWAFVVCRVRPVSHQPALRCWRGDGRSKAARWRCRALGRAPGS